MRVGAVHDRRVLEKLRKQQRVLADSLNGLSRVSLDLLQKDKRRTLTRRSPMVRLFLALSSKLFAEPSEEANTSSPRWYDCHFGIVL